MKLVDMTICDFSDEVDSNSPAPGGGSVSALAGNIGVGLARMMAHLSFGKKKCDFLLTIIYIRARGRVDRGFDCSYNWI